METEVSVHRKEKKTENRTNIVFKVCKHYTGKKMHICTE